MVDKTARVHICVCRLPVPWRPHFLCGSVRPCPFQTKSIISIWWCSQAGLSGGHCLKLMCLISGLLRTPITLWKLFEDAGATLTFYPRSVVSVLLYIPLFLSYLGLNSYFCLYCIFSVFLPHPLLSLLLLCMFARIQWGQRSETTFPFMGQWALFAVQATGIRCYK